MSNSKWELNSLDKLGFVGRGKSRHRPRNAPVLYGGPYPFIQTAEITNSNLYITSYSQTYSEMGLAQSKLWDEDTLCIVNAGVNTGDNAILRFKACFPDSIIAFVPNAKKADIRFIKYYLDTIKPRIRHITMGATQDNLSVSKLLSFKIPTPPLPTQKKITAVLSAYDDLIENNNKRIALLEKAADEIYREWFVRLRFPGWETASFHKGIPKGWEIKKLPEVAKITYGYPFKSKQFNSEGVGKPIIRIRNIPDSSTSDFTEEEAAEKYIIKKGDLLVGMDGEFHINHWYGEDAYLVQRVCKIEAKKQLFSGYLAKAVYSPIKYYEAILLGATVAHLGAKHLRAINLLWPSPAMYKHIELFNRINTQKINLASANNNLKKTRDMLLSRLISGKLSVDDLDIQFPPSMIAT